MASAPQRTSWQQKLQAAWLTRGVLAAALWPVSLVFSALVTVRVQLFRWGWLRATKAAVPVWVVGNLVVGGAGKTPTVLALYKWLVQQGHKPGIVSRGYGGTVDDRAGGVQEVLPDSSPAEVGDEPLLLRRRSQAPVFVGKSRIAAINALLAQYPQVNIVISDDGLQHLRLKRDLQLIVFDGRGAGNGWLLPAGPLRQPLPRELPKRSVVLYNCATASTHLPGHIARAQLSGAVSWSAWQMGQPATLDTLTTLAAFSQQQPLLAVAGIAQPERFFNMLRQSGLNITPLPLPDHHDYNELPWPSDTTDVIVTEKDAVKLNKAVHAHTRVWVVPLDLHWDQDMDDALLDALYRSKRSSQRTHSLLH
ncbi:MAG: tetraacyldisaccharide 4'-kinase [Burkholderiales bacterium]